MDGVKLNLVVSSMLILWLTISSALSQDSCGKLKFIKPLNKSEGSIKFKWTIPICSRNITGYKIIYGTIGGLLNYTLFKRENGSSDAEVILNNLIPGKRYMIVFTVQYAGNKTSSKRPIYKTSGKASNSTTSSPGASTQTTSNPSTKSKSNGGAIAAGVVAFVVVMVMIALTSVWLIKRRRNSTKTDGPHYISVVSRIGNESVLSNGRLNSCPGYLQIIHDDYLSVDYEIPCNSVNQTTETTLFPNETEYARRELQGCADSNSSIDSVMVTVEPIQTTSFSSTTTKLHINNAQITKGKKKLVKPYAVVDVADIEAKAGLEASGGVLDGHATKHQKHRQLLCNREALKKSFALSDSYTTQVEHYPSTSPSNILSGRYYTVPVYVNLNIPMTVNPSYNKNKI